MALLFYWQRHSHTVFHSHYHINTLTQSRINTMAHSSILRWWRGQGRRREQQHKKGNTYV